MIEHSRSGRRLSMADKDAGEVANQGDHLDPARISRRSTLFGMAAAGVAAWTAPTILSVPAASAATVAPAACSAAGSCGSDPCLDQTLCGSQNGNPCYCSSLFDGSGCVCTESIACASAALCDAVTPCPPGYVCQNSCCGGSRCFPLCA
jgi:hypothetical protein